MRLFIIAPVLGLAALIGQPPMAVAQQGTAQAENPQKRNTETQPEGKIGPLETDSKTGAAPTSPEGGTPEGMQVKRGSPPQPKPN